MMQLHYNTARLSVCLIVCCISCMLKNGGLCKHKTRWRPERTQDQDECRRFEHCLLIDGGGGVCVMCIDMVGSRYGTYTVHCRYMVHTVHCTTES